MVRSERVMWAAARGAALLLCVAAASGCESSLRCGEGTVQDGPDCVPDTTLLAPRVQKVELTQLFVEPQFRPLLLTHQTTIKAQLQITGERLSTDVVFGLEPRGGGAGCVLGGGALDHAPDAMDDSAPVTAELTVDARVPASCQPLVGRTDLVVFAAFDPFREAAVAGRAGFDSPVPEGEEADPESFEGTPATSYDLAKGSQVPSAATCVDCAREHELRASPGRDVELRSLSLASSVAVLETRRHEIPAQTLAEIQEANGTLGLAAPLPTDLVELAPYRAKLGGEPHFMVSGTFRTLGLDVEERLPAGQIAFAAAIRPLPGGVHVDTVPTEDLDFLPLGIAGIAEESEVENDSSPEHGGSDEPAVTAGYFLTGDARARMDGGTWDQVTEFELRFCVVPAFAEATYEGEAAPRENNCLQGPVTVVRRAMTPTGPETTVADDGLATSWERMLGWQRLWGSKSSAAAELAFWLTMGFSSSPGAQGFGLGGSTITGKGGWYEAGARATACVFNSCADLARAQATLKDQQSSADTFFMEGRILIFDFLPRVQMVWPDGKLTLKQVLALISNAKGKEYSSVKSFEKEIIGKKFTIPVINKTIEASVKAFVDLGLDDQDTAIEKQPIAPSGDPCTGRTVVNGQCFALAAAQWHNPGTLAAACRAQFGEESWPAIVRTPAEYDVARAAVGASLPALVGHIYTGNLGPGGKVTLWTSPADFFVPQLYNPWAAIFQPINDYPGKAQMVAIDSIPDFGEGFVSLPTTTRARYGLCGLRQHPPILGGSKITVTVVPFVAAGVRATLQANFGAISAFAQGTLNVIRASLEFLGSLGNKYRSDERVAISLGRSITLGLSVLSGSIDVGARLSFKAPCIPKFWKSCKYNLSGSVTILSWGGFRFDIPVLQLETTTLVL